MTLGVVVELHVEIFDFLKSKNSFRKNSLYPAVLLHDFTNFSAGGARFFQWHGFYGVPHSAYANNLSG